MRIITWNVNGLRAVEKKWELQSLIAKHDPDILFMQEIKGTPDKFSVYLNVPPDYNAFYNPAEKAGYAGTGVWIHERVQKYVHSIQTGFEWDPTANEGRVTHLILEKEDQILDIFGIYFPNGGKSPEAWQGKLVFYSEFSKRMDELRAEWRLVLWWGDINCAHQTIDLARPKENDGKIGFHPLERAWLDNRTSDGWSDIWRVQNPTTTEVYSWWDPVTRSRERNVGWRIDALWGDAEVFKRTQKIGYLQEQMGSDHCPMYIELDW